MARSVERSGTATSAHLAAMDWLTSHPEALADYEGEWVAVADGRVLAHGESVAEVVRSAERQGYDDPLPVPVMPYPFIGV